MVYALTTKGCKDCLGDWFLACQCYSISYAGPTIPMGSTLSSNPERGKSRSVLIAVGLDLQFTQQIFSGSCDRPSRGQSYAAEKLHSIASKGGKYEVSFQRL